jgi:hypothetical protein
MWEPGGTGLLAVGSSRMTPSKVQQGPNPRRPGPPNPPPRDPPSPPIHDPPVDDDEEESPFGDPLPGNDPPDPPIQTSGNGGVAQ